MIQPESGVANEEVRVCTEHSPNEFTVCDVALPDVKSAVGQMESVRFVHKPYEGTLVVNDSAGSSSRFTEGILTAIAKQAASAGPS